MTTIVKPHKHEEQTVCDGCRALIPADGPLYKVIDYKRRVLYDLVDLTDRLDFCSFYCAHAERAKRVAIRNVRG